LPETRKVNCDGWSDSVSIPGWRLKQAVEKGLMSLGRAAVESIIADLEKDGINLSSKSGSSYTICEIETALDKIFGKDVAPQLMEKIKRELGKEGQTEF
jgi:hypothetical protein